MAVKIPIVKKRTAKFKSVDLLVHDRTSIHLAFCFLGGINPTGTTV